MRHTKTREIAPWVPTNMKNTKYLSLHFHANSCTLMFITRMIFISFLPKTSFPSTTGHTFHRLFVIMDPWLQYVIRQYGQSGTV